MIVHNTQCITACPELDYTKTTNPVNKGHMSREVIQITLHQRSTHNAGKDIVNQPQVTGTAYKYIYIL